MKKIISVLLAAVMASSILVGTVAGIQAPYIGLTVSSIAQTSSRYDLGIDAENVRLGWQLDSGVRGDEQSAYQVVVRDSKGVVWDSGWQVSSEQTGIQAQNLKPETVYTWQVNVKDQNGVESGFSEQGTFETAPENIDGQWIGTGSKLVKKTFTLDQDISNIDRARAYVGSTSLIETRMNGQKVGELVLAPKQPVPDVRCYYNTHDVLPYLENGENTTGIMLGNVTPMGGKAKGMIKIYYKDGGTQTVATGTDWRANDVSPVTRADFFAGEDQNPNLLAGWDTNSFIEDATWTNALTAGSTVLSSTNGQLVVPSNSGMYYTRQSFSGDYTIELAVEVKQNAFGLLFGSGNPNPALWQFNVSEGGLFKVHEPGNWSTNQAYTESDIQYNTILTMNVEVAGNTVKSYLGDQLIDTRELGAGQTDGPIGIRSAPNEAFNLDYIKVTQNNGVIWEDDFDTVDSTKWNIPSDPILEPAVSAAKVINEVAPVSIKKVETGMNTSKPHVVDGELIMPTNCGMYYTNQSFNGDYTIELETTIISNAFGFMFGSGSPNPALWQMNVIEGNVFKTHQPGDWSLRQSFPSDKVQYDTPLTVKIDVVGNTVTSYLNEEQVNQCTFADGQTAGRFGLRATIGESFTMDYIKVTQNGGVIWEDNFDTLDTSKWDFPEQPQIKENYVVDFGKNMSGYARLSGTGTQNSTVTLKYAEMANADGSIYANTTFHFPTNTYTWTGGNDTFEPKFFSTGYRYVEVENFPGELTAENITGCFVSDDNTIIGTFSSSNDRFDKIFDLYQQSQLSNLVGNYTDCPQREKDGWTGDASVVKEASGMLLNDYTSAEAYMKTMYDNIYANGQPLVRVPKPASSPQGQDEFGFIDTPWTSAYFVFPYETYMQTGDKYYIEMAFESISKVFDFYKTLDTNNDYIIENNTFGDWLGYDNQNGKVERGYLSSTYTYYSGMLLSKMAEIIGEDHTELDAYLSNMYNALHAKYNKNTYFGTDTQTSNSMAIDFNLIAADQKDAVVDALVKNVANANDTILTGVLGTKSMYDVLSKENEHKVLLDMTINPEKCSFGYMLDNGATTLWEYWDKAGETFNSNNPPAENRWDSQNHAMMGGGLATWAFKGLGGITQTSAAYHDITYRAGVESELSFVNTTIDTIIGTAESNWTNEDGVFTWDIVVPTNATAEIIIPMSDATTITESGKDIFKKDGNGITYVGQEDGMYVYTVGGGSYNFEATNKEVPPVDPVDSNKKILEFVIDYAQKAIDDSRVDALVPTAKANFMVAFENATKVFNNTTATQDQVNQAWALLMDAIHTLSLVVGDKSDLNALIQVCEAYDLNDIDGDTTVFTITLAAAKVVSADPDAMDNDIQQAHDALNTAMKALIFKDRTVLEAVIGYADTRMAIINLYQDGEAKTAFIAAVDEAKEILADRTSSQLAIDATTTALLEATSKLRLIANKETLDQILKDAKGTDLSVYTTASAAAFEDAITAAQNVLDNPAATEQEIADAQNKILEAKSGLINKDTTPDPIDPVTPEDPTNPVAPETTPVDKTDVTADGANGTTNTKSGTPTTGQSDVVAVAAALLLIGASVVFVSKRKNSSK